MTTAATSNTPWPTVKLGDVCEVARGGSPRPIKNYITTDSDGLNWIKIGDVSPNGKYIEKTSEKIKPSGLNKTRKVSVGDFLLSNSMSFGRPYILKIDGCIHDGWLVLKGFKNVLDEHFFYYLLKSDVVQNQFELYAHGSTVRNLNTKSVEDVIIPLPPLEVQREIVAKVENGLAEADALAAHFKRLAVLADELKRPIIQRAVQGMLVEQRQEEGLAEELYLQIQDEKRRLIKLGKLKKETPFPEITHDEIPFGIPSSWKWVRLGELGQLKNGYSFKSSEYTEEGVQVVRISDLDEDTISDKNAVFYPLMKELESFQVVDGSILICMTGSIGKMAWVRDGVLRYLNQRVGMFVATIQTVMPYLWYGLHIDYVIDGWMKSKTSTNGNIRSSDITNLLVPLPPLEEQKRIVEKLEAELARCERLKAEAERGVKAAEALRKAVLAEAFEQ